MLSFKQFLLEFTEGEIDRATIRGTGSIFTKAAGYEQSGREEFNPRASALVHVTNYFPTDGKIQTTAQGSRGEWGRETVHFTRNGLVGDHLSGQWKDKSFVTILPEHHIQDRILYSGDHDNFVYGAVDLPHQSRILVHGGRLDDKQKAHITKLVGARHWDEAHEKIRAFDPEKGIHGHEVDFGGRKINISGLTDEEMKSNTALADATHRHLNSLKIQPIKIGNHYSVGYAELGQRSYTDSRRDENDFRRIYGNDGLVQKHYMRKRNPENVGGYSTDLDQSFKYQGSGLHWDSPHGHEETIAFDKAHPDRKRLADVLQHIRDNPTDYHPTAYSHPDAQAALERQIRGLRS
jgi:hypothetical protein